MLVQNPRQIKHSELPIDYEHVKTHYEAALVDGYGSNSDDPDMRWDLS